MTGLRLSPCGSCRELVIWCLTDAGERMPVDPDPVKGGNLLLSPAESPPRVSVVSKGGRPPGTRLYISHFKTCRSAQVHRSLAAARRAPQSRPSSPPAPSLFSDRSQP